MASESEHEQPDGEQLVDGRDFAFTHGAVCVSHKAADGKLKWRFLHHKQIRKTEDGTVFIQMNMRYSNIQRLLTSSLKVDPKKVWNAIANTDVLDQLGKLKTDAVQHMIEGDANSDAKRFRADRKSYTKNRLNVPEYITITAPRVEHVDSVDMRVLSDRRSKCIYVEMQDANLKYMRDAIAAQYSAGGVQDICAKRRGRKRQAADVDGASPEGVDDSAPVEDETQDSTSHNDTDTIGSPCTPTTAAIVSPTVDSTSKLCKSKPRTPQNVMQMLQGHRK
jgi:hypothetical protein